MPESQVFSTSNSYVKYKINVIVNSQSIENNTSNITVNVFFYRTNQGYSTYGSGTCSCGINGESYSQSVSPSQKITSSGVILFSKTLDIGHDNDGSKSVWVSARISLNTPLSSSDQGFNASLPTIPRMAICTGADDFKDTENPKIYFNNSKNFKLQMKIEAGGNDQLIVRDNIRGNGSYTFKLSEDERNRLRQLCPNSNTLGVRFTVATYMPGQSSPNNWSFVDRTMTIVNAKPSFSGLSYKDTKTAVVSVTGNDQWIVRNKSSLQIHFSSATAKKYASISKYLIDFAGSMREVTSSGNHTIGIVNSSQSLTLKVSAIDSRGNSTTLSKTVTIFDWIEPIVNVSAARINNFENEIKLKSNTEISSVNNINAITSLQYRAKKVDTTEWGSWVSFENKVNTIISLDNLFAWDLEIRAIDKFGSSGKSLVVPKGIPIMYFDTKKLSVGVNCFPSKNKSFEINGKTLYDLIYPVGTIYFSNNETNPGEMFSGTTWNSVSSGNGEFKWVRKK